MLLSMNGTRAISCILVQTAESPDTKNAPVPMAPVRGMILAVFRITAYSYRDFSFIRCS